MSATPPKPSTGQSTPGQPPESPEPTHMSPGDEAPPGTPGTGENACRHCGGSGRLEGRPCPHCEGSGTVVSGIGGA